LSGRPVRPKLLLPDVVRGFHPTEFVSYFPLSIPFGNLSGGWREDATGSYPNRVVSSPFPTEVTFTISLRGGEEGVVYDTPRAGWVPPTPCELRLTFLSGRADDPDTNEDGTVDYSEFCNAFSVIDVRDREDTSL